jgi:hypothetical protein
MVNYLKQSDKGEVMNTIQTTELMKIIVDSLNVNPDANTLEIAKDYYYDNELKINKGEIEKIRFNALMST